MFMVEEGCRQLTKLTMSIGRQSKTIYAYKPVSSGIDRKIFTDEFNLGFYKPKKDHCPECAKFELLNATEREEYKSQIEQHLERNREDHAAKAVDKE